MQKKIEKFFIDEKGAITKKSIVKTGIFLFLASLLMQKETSGKDHCSKCSFGENLTCLQPSGYEIATGSISDLENLGERARSHSSHDSAACNDANGGAVTLTLDDSTISFHANSLDLTRAGTSIIAQHSHNMINGCGPGSTLTSTADEGHCSCQDSSPCPGGH
ncbi:hypothetical protein KY345_00340 [Candidatus Woesearchaeota archaeon]|nr:hypothetical protein [Candidatus Woesearchaeota archaeon]